MSNIRTLRKSAISIAMGLCLSSLVITPVFAQSTTGSVAGRASAGDEIVVINTATGLSRTVTVGTDGSYRLSQLPIGDYTLKLSRAGKEVGQPVPVNVGLGGTTTVNLSDDGSITNLESVEVIGSRVVNRVDVHSTETSTNITREEIARLPVEQSVAAVALLVPGVIASGATFGGLSFGGSSVAENVVYINGLDVTDPYRRQGFSSVPFAFYQEFQVKTGGYSAEYGRSTGGVVNAVTRSGGNEFHAGAELTIEPDNWEASKHDHFHTDGTLDERDRTSRDGGPFYKANIWASGPIVKDKLFFFAMYEKRKSDPNDIDTIQAWLTKSDNDFWGTKFNWQITDNHLVELLAFSDKSKSPTDVYLYTWNTATLGRLKGDSISNSGGNNWSLTYTGHLTDNFVAKVLYGVNKRSAGSSSSQDVDCSIVTRSGSYTQAFGAETTPEGCHPTESSVSSRYDKREAMRMDFEWTLGDHLVRFGMDKEVMDSNSSVVYPGDGRSYQAQAATAGGSLNGTVIPAGTTAIIDARRYITGTPVTTDAAALYVEDNWNVTPDLLLNLGLRADKFHNKYDTGVTFAQANFNDMISPRLGFSWDMKGDGTTKLFGNAGRYYLPLTNKLADYFAGTTDEHTYYVLEGWQQLTHPVAGTYLKPILGAQIGPVNTNGNIPAPDDFRTVVARDLKMPFQDEFILGFQQAINQAWSYGVNATYRKMTRTVEDVSIRHVEGCPWYSGDWPIINPGETNTLWCPDTNDWVTFDNSVDGYKATGSGKIFGYSKPKRTYTAIEFQLDRAWDDKWAFNASYQWSKSEGNMEGPVNSDTGYADTNLVQYFDHPAVNQRYGPLFNDHRHQLKLRGSYKFNEAWLVGATFATYSGGPISAYGVRWPDDNRSVGGPGEFSGGGSGWLCQSGCGDWKTRQLVFSPLGAYGRMPWVQDLNANVTWTIPVPTGALIARLSVYNLFNNQAVVNVHSRYESTPGTQMPYFGQAKGWQSPRYMQLVVNYTY